jgi:hypothetical protein
VEDVERRINDIRLAPEPCNPHAVEADRLAAGDGQAVMSLAGESASGRRSRAIACPAWPVSQKGRAPKRTHLLHSPFEPVQLLGAVAGFCPIDS